MKFLVVLLLLMGPSFLWAQTDNGLSAIYLPFRNETGVYLAKQPFKNQSNRIKIEWIDFKNSNDFIYVVKNLGRFGMIDLEGKLIAPFVYDSIVKHKFCQVAWKNGFFDYCYYRDKIHEQIQADSVQILGEHLYYYQNGLIGIVDDVLLIEPLYKALRPWRLFSTDFDPELKRQYYFAVMLNNDLQILNSIGRELLPSGVQQVNEVSFGIIRFYDDVWKYYLSKPDKIVSSDGNDIIFYSQYIYKKYNANRTKATLYNLSSNKTYTQQYDDYFYLSNERYLAVRKDSLIGMIDASSQKVVLPLQYHQINVLNDWIDEFRVYKNDLCGLVNTNNELIIPIQYHNIEKTGNPGYYYTYLNNRMGLAKTGGEVVFPNQFTRIHVFRDKNIVLNKEQKYGLANFKGEIICPLEYSRYKFELLNDEPFFEFYKEGYFVLYNTKGQLYPDKYKYAVFGNDCIKLYTKDNKIVVLYINENGEIEEAFVYQNTNSIQVSEALEYAWELREGLIFDEHEEHQLTGKFGKRYFANKGLSVDPKYTIVVANHNRDLVMGELPNPAFQYSLVPGVELVANRHFDYILHNGGNNFYMNEIINAQSWGPDSYHLTLSYSKIWHPYANSKCASRLDKKGAKLLYAEDIGFENIRKLTYGTHITIEKIELSDMSLYDYFRWVNNIGVFELSAEDLIRLMNPKLGVKFHNASYIVCESNDKFKKQKRDYFDDCQEFEFFEFDAESQLKWFKSKSQDLAQIQQITFTDPKNRSIIPFNLGSTWFPERELLACERNREYSALINPEFPNFDFVTNSFNIDYQNGLLIQRISKANYRLIKPDNTILLSDIDSASFIMNGLFLVRKKGEKLFSIYSLVENSIVLNDVVEVVETALRYTQLRIKINPNVSFVSGSDLIYCSVEGKISTEKPLGVKDPFENIPIKTRTTKIWDLYNSRTLESTKFAFHWNIYFTEFFVVFYNDSYFYLLDNDLNLIYE